MQPIARRVDLPPLVPRLLHLAPLTLHFMWRVLGAFMNNRGILLAGGVGYNILLSIVPLFALLIVLLAGVVDQRQLFTVLTVQLNHLAPAHAEVVLQAVRSLIDSKEAIGALGIPVLLIFSSFAFRNLEDALAIIFRSSSTELKRSVWISALMPYAFMVVLGVGLMALALAVSLFTGINTLWVVFLGHELPLASLSGTILNLASFVGVFLLFSAIYKVMPVERIALRRALVGGFVAALLWEGVRLLLVLYFANLSYVNAVYGSLATLIVLLLSLEIGAVILLLGAQVIAELERNVKLGIPWYQDSRKLMTPPTSPS